VWRRRSSDVCDAAGSRTIRRDQTPPVIVALLSVEMYLPASQSLKDKRMVLRRLKDRLGAMNVAVAEVAHQDLWQRAGLGVVTVASSDEVAEQTLQAALHEIERLEPGLVTASQVEYLR
jgi:uncharacterized protein YlxP (DUF503 family)